MPTASGGSKNVVPTDAIGVLVNVTVVAPTHEGFLSLRPQGATGDPTTSTVNFVPGSIEPNAATVDLNDGKIQIWVETSSDAGSADVLIDVVGYTIGHTHDDRYYTEADIDAATDQLHTRVSDLEAAVAPLVNSVAATAGGGQLIDLTGTVEIVRTVSLMPPADGTVIVNSSAHLFGSIGADGRVGGRCSITTGTAIDFSFLQLANMADIPEAAAVLSGTRGFPVTEGVLATFNLVCDETFADVRLQDSSLTAIFAPS